MNKVILSGNICRDVEKERSKSGIAVVNNCVAVKREFKDKDGEYGVDFINFTAFDKKAEYLASYAHKGDRVEIVGRWNTRLYTDKDNRQRTANEVVVESVNVYGNRRDDQPKQERKRIDTNSLPTDDDLPF